MKHENAGRENSENLERLEAVAGKMGRLKPQQVKAVALILTGCGLGDAAERVGVSRATLHNWTHHNEEFMAAMESWRNDMRRATRTRLIAMSNLGVKAISQALESGDARVALTMFKGLGVLSPEAAEEDKRDEGKTILVRITDRSPRVDKGA
jgi:hypothetical protein